MTDSQPPTEADVAPVKRVEELPADAQVHTTEHPEAITLSPGLRRILHASVAILVPVALVWFAWTSWPALIKGPWDVKPDVLVVAVALYFVSEGMGPLSWLPLMRATGTHTPGRAVYFVWFAVEPTVYLPLPIGPLFGKFALADRAGLRPLPAVVTIAYQYVISLVVTLSIAMPGFIWIGIVVKPSYRWVVFLTIGFLLLFGFAILRPGGLSRVIADLLGTHAHGIEEIQIPHKRLIAPALIVLVQFTIRICAAGTLFAALTAVPAWKIPVAGLVFASSSVAAFGRFGTREAFIVVGLSALGFAVGPAALAAVASRAVGLGVSLLWLALSVLAGGGHRAHRSGPEEGNTHLDIEVSSNGLASSRD